VGKMAASVNAVEEQAVAAGVASPAQVWNVQNRQAGRRGSVQTFLFGRAAHTAIPPSADQVSLGVLIEALEHMARFAERHAAAESRYLLYSGWLQRIVNRAADAEELLKRSAAVARRAAMPLDAALAMRELGRLERERENPDAAREHLEFAYVEFERMAAASDAEEAKAELMLLPGGFRQPDAAMRGHRKGRRGSKPVGFLGLGRFGHTSDSTSTSSSRNLLGSVRSLSPSPMSERSVVGERSVSPAATPDRGASPAPSDPENSLYCA
jgi:hypothetical protein